MQAKITPDIRVDVVGQDPIIVTTDEEKPFLLMVFGDDEVDSVSACSVADLFIASYEITKALKHIMRDKSTVEEARSIMFGFLVEQLRIMTEMQEFSEDLLGKRNDLCL